MNIKKILLFLLFAVYLFALGKHAYMILVCGLASVFTTLLLYITITLILLALLHLLQKKIISQPTAFKLRIVVLSLMVSLFVGELALRYVVQRGLSQNEKSGDLYYKSPYRRCIKEVDLDQFKINNSFIFINPKNTEKVNKTIDFSFLHRYNEMGLRERSVDNFPTDTSTFKIIGLGHSFMEGVGVPQDSTGLRQLESRLNEELDSSSVFTINGARGGSDLVFEYVKLRDYLAPLDPDLVVLDINRTDIMSAIYRGGMERFENEVPLRSSGAYSYKGPWWEPIYASSLYVRGFVHYVLKYNRFFIPSRELRKRMEKGMQEVNETLQLFQDLGEEQGFKFIVVLWPLRDEIDRNRFRLGSVYINLRDSTDIHCISLYDEFLNLEKTEQINIGDLFWQNDMHPNSKGQGMWSRLVYEYIKDNDWID